MNDLDLTLGVHAPVLLPVKGREEPLKLTPITKGVQADFSAWLEFLARKKVHSQRNEVDEDTFAAMLLKVGDKADLGYYRFFGQHASRMISRQDGAGARKMFHLMLLYHQPRMTEEEAYAIFDANTVEVTAAVQQMMSAGKNGVSPAVVVS